MEYSQNGYTRVGTIDTTRVGLTNAQRYVPATHRLLDGEVGTTHVRVDLSNNYNEFLEIISHVTGTNADTNVIKIYAARGDNEDYVWVCSLATVTGTMVVRGGGATKLYNDAMTVTEKDAAFETVESSTATNEYARVWLNRNGCSKWLFLVSTLNSTDITVEIAGLDRQAIPTVA